MKIYATLLLTFISLMTQAQFYWKNPLPQGNTLTSIHSANGNTLAVGHFGTVLKRLNDSIWKIKPSGTTENLNSVFCVDAQTAFAAGDWGTVIKTEDGGENWSETSYVAFEDFYSVFFINNSTGFVGGTGGTLYKTTDAGNSWHGTEIFSNGYIYSIYFTSQDTGYIACGDNIYKTADCGTTWNLIYTSEFVAIKAIWFLDSQTGFATMGDYWTPGYTIKTVDAGNTWLPLSNVIIGTVLHFSFLIV